MKLSNNSLWGLLILIFGAVTFFMERFMVSFLGKVWCEWITGIILFFLVFLYWSSGRKEKDERELQLRQEADSISLYVIILGLLAASVFEHDMEMDGVFWAVLALAVIGRGIAFLYQWYQYYK